LNGRETCEVSETSQVSFIARDNETRQVSQNLTGLQCLAINFLLIQFASGFGIRHGMCIG
jgi:hypothetical protein